MIIEGDKGKNVLADTGNPYVSDCPKIVPSWSWFSTIIYPILHLFFSRQNSDLIFCTKPSTGIKGLKSPRVFRVRLGKTLIEQNCERNARVNWTDMMHPYSDWRWLHAHRSHRASRSTCAPVNSLTHGGRVGRHATATSTIAHMRYLRFPVNQQNGMEGWEDRCGRTFCVRYDEGCRVDRAYMRHCYHAQGPDEPMNSSFPSIRLWGEVQSVIEERRERRRKNSGSFAPEIIKLFMGDRKKKTSFMPEIL